MSRPQDNPKEHERMRGDSDENDSGTNESMSTNESTDTDELERMNVYQRNESTYIVGNPESGTAYVVNMCNPDHDGSITCKCPDYRFRAEDSEHRACKHIQKVIEVGKSEIGVAQLAHEGLKQQYDILESKVDSMMQELSAVNADVKADVSASQSGSVPASDAAGDGQQMQEISAEEAAEKLKEAYPVQGMDVQEHNGQVWVNKTPEAPDYTFSAFLQEPQLMQYDPDNGPGQYWKNYLEPGDVDEYIAEVLE